MVAFGWVSASDTNMSGFPLKTVSTTERSTEGSVTKSLKYSYLFAFTFSLHGTPSSKTVSASELLAVSVNRVPAAAATVT